MKTPSSKTPSSTRKTKAAKPAAAAAPAARRARPVAAKSAKAEPAAKAEPKARAKAPAKPRAKAATEAVEKPAKAPRAAKAEKPAKQVRKAAKPEAPAKAATVAKTAKADKADKKPASRRRRAETTDVAADAPTTQGALAFEPAPPAPVTPAAAVEPPAPEPARAKKPESAPVEPPVEVAAAATTAPLVNGAAPDDHLGFGHDLDEHDWEEGTTAEISVDDVLAADEGDHEDDDEDDEDEDDDGEGADDEDEDESDDDEDDEDDEDDGEDLDAGHAAASASAARDHDEDDDEEDDDQDDDEEEHDDTPLGETVTTEAGGGLDPAVAAAARRLGIQRLYPEQARTIREVISGRDVLIVMPTGFGKSACYQVPSMLLPSPVVLISPLLALLKDQHEKLIKYNIPCVRIDGTVRGRARAEAMARIAKGGSLLVMTTPETLGSEEMHHVLTKSGISLAAIDEAHCISEWGFDFRPAYLRLGETLRKLGRPPLLALTATATEKVRTDIVRFLGMRTPTIVASSPHRSNLAFEVLECREAARLRALARLAQRLRRPGIIYCSTTRDVDTVYTILMKLGIPSHRYHGKMAAGDRVKQQEMYMKPGRRTVMVATSAFGLGIDKPDIRYVVHQQSPASLEQYVQEAGRAGRDGAKANCILLHDSSDRTVHEALLSRSRLRPDQLYKLGSALAAWAAEGRTPTIDALALSADLGERPTNALLATLEEAGLVKISEDFLVRATCPPSEVEEKVRSLAGQFANMRTQDSRRLDAVADYSQDNGCRAVYLRSYFGEDGGGACGLCDVCRGRPDRPSTFWSPVAAPKRMNKKRRRGRSGQQPQHQQRPQQGGGRRRRGRRRRGGGQQNPQQMNMRQGGPNQNQQHQHPRPQQHGQPQQHGGGGPQQGGNPQQSQMGGGGPNDGQRRRRRRRRGRRGRRGRPNQGTPAPTTSGDS
ncbi:MAG: RecQ family ATP-dependent DNA helicase [Candidatus Binatia bacterium]